MTETLVSTYTVSYYSSLVNNLIHIQFSFLQNKIIIHLKFMDPCEHELIV